MAQSTVQGQLPLQTSLEDFGADFLVDKNYDPVLLATGEPVMTSGTETVAQDVRLAMKTPQGALFYDPDFGSGLLSYVHEERTDANDRHFEMDIIDCILSDPRVEYHTARAKVVTSMEKVVAECAFEVAGTNINNQYRIEVGQTVEVL